MISASCGFMIFYRHHHFSIGFVVWQAHLYHFSSATIYSAHCCWSFVIRGRHFRANYFNFHPFVIQFQCRLRLSSLRLDVIAVMMIPYPCLQVMASSMNGLSVSDAVANKGRPTSPSVDTMLSPATTETLCTLSRSASSFPSQGYASSLMDCLIIQDPGNLNYKPSLSLCVCKSTSQII